MNKKWACLLYIGLVAFQAHAQQAENASLSEANAANKERLLKGGKISPRQQMELKRAEKAMRESEATLKLAIETTGLGTFDLDLTTDRQFWSDIAKRHFGLPPEARVDRDTFRRGVHPDDFERVD